MGAGPWVRKLRGHSVRAQHLCPARRVVLRNGNKLVSHPGLPLADNPDNLAELLTYHR
jgi:hypothetical protein